MLDTDGAESFVHPDFSIDFSEDASVALWSLGRRPHNVDSSKVKFPRALSIAEAGLLNFVQHQCGKELSDSSQVMVMLEGPTSAAADAGYWRFVGIVTGTCWSPRLFDVAVCEFQDDQDRASCTLGLPSLVVITTSLCRSAPAFAGVKFLTSDEMVQLVTDSLPHRIELYSASYTVGTSIDQFLQ